MGTWQAHLYVVRSPGRRESGWWELQRTCGGKGYGGRNTSLSRYDLSLNSVSTLVSVATSLVSILIQKRLPF